MSTSTRIGIGIVLFAGLMTATAQTAANEDSPAFAAASPSVEAAVASALSTGDAAFIKNAGQWDAPEIRYALDSHGVNVGLTDKGPRFQIFMRPKVEPDSDDESRSTASGTRAFPSATRERGGNTSRERDDEDEPFVGPPLPEDMRRKEPDPERASKLHEFGIVFEGAAVTTPQGRKQVGQTYNYLVGGPDRRRENVPAFESVWYEGLYPGVDLELRGRRSGLKYNFHVAPGADPSAIRIRYEGVEGIALAEKGALKIDLDEGWDPLTDSAPYIYQLVDGKKVSVAGRYEILDRQTCGFAITGTYDPALPLVIDPAVAWGSYLGGEAINVGGGVVVDRDGDILVTGWTSSSGWVFGGWATAYGGGNWDAFVVKLTSEGAHVWSSYLGGTGEDWGMSIAGYGRGSLLVTGKTSSSGWVSGGWDTTLDGELDAFVVKLTSEGAHVWSSYLGGTGEDWGLGIAVDGDGGILATGLTESSAWVSGGWDTTLDGDYDAFVVKLTIEGAHVWSSYLGGDDWDGEPESPIGSISVDGGGNVLVTGVTKSSGWVSGGWDTTLGGDYDAFVVKLTSSGAHAWSSYLGGARADAGWGIAVDGDGNVLVTGVTKSSGWVSGGWDTTFDGDCDGFVVKLTSEGSHAWSSCLGGTGEDWGASIALNGAGDILVTGPTESSSWVSGGWDTTYGGGDYDGFVVKLTSEGAHAWSSFLGGTGEDVGVGIAVDGGENVLVTGATESSGWLFGGWDTTYSGGPYYDGFVVKIVDSGGLGEAEHASDGELQTAGEPALDGEPDPMEAEAGEGEGQDEAEGEGEGWGDPGISWSTYLGGSDYDAGLDIAVDGGGNVLITGGTGTSGWVSGGWDDTHNGDWDAFVVKLTSSGAHVWSTYLGGSNWECGEGIAVDAAGSALVCGTTESSGWVSGGWDTTLDSDKDAFVVKLTSSGAHAWSSYLGGSSWDQSWAVAADSDGNVLITGTTYSFDWISGGWDTTLAPSKDGFVVKLTSSGAHVWSSYLGGSGGDWGSGIVVDGGGNVLVTGTTNSSGWISGAWDSTYNGGGDYSGDAFVVKLTSSGAHAWSSYLGGSGSDGGAGIAVDGAGNVLVAGKSESSGWVSGGWDTTLDGDKDAFVVKLTFSGAHIWSSYLGGEGDDSGSNIAVDGDGDLLVTGETRSSGWVSGGRDTTHNGESDGFVVRLTSSGAHTWSSYLGGDGIDFGNGIAVDGGGNVLVTGGTMSSGWVSGGWDTTYNDDIDAFVVRIVKDGGAGEVEGEGKGGEVPSVDGEADEGEGEGEDVEPVGCLGGKEQKGFPARGDLLVTGLTLLVLVGRRGFGGMRP